MKNSMIILIGPPGAGKGTQAKNVSASNNYILISTGDLLRDNVGKRTELGLKAKSFMDKGELVPTDLVVDMIKSELKKYGADKNFLFDGFPRNLTQNELLKKMLIDFKRDIDKVIYIDVDDSVIYDRLTNRRVCPKCKRVYHLKYNPPKKDNLCDDCNVSLIIRDDDKQDVIKKRLEVYHGQTAPLIEYYKGVNKLVAINGENNPQDVYKDIASAL